MEHGTTDKNKTSYIATTSPRSHKIASLDQTPPCPPPPCPPFLNLLLLVFVYSSHPFFLFILVCLLRLYRKMTLQSPPPPTPRSCLWPLWFEACVTMCVTGDPIMKGLGRDRDSLGPAQGTLASRLTTLLAPGSAQCPAWFTRISLYPPAVSISYVGFLP